MPASKKSDERVGKLLECLRAAMPVKRACQFAGINKDTYYDWYNTDASFRLEADYAKSHAIRALIAATAKKDPWKILKNIDSEHFKDDVPQLTQNNYKLIVNTTNGPVDLSGNVRHNEEPQAEQRLPVE